MFEGLLQGVAGKWLVTGAAGFIGSNIVEALLSSGQQVVALDNFATGHRENLNAVVQKLGLIAAQKLTVIEGDIRSFATCQSAVQGISYVLHQAGLGSVPRSIKDPLTTNDVNVSGFLYVLEASRLAGVKSFVYAASSSTYGDEPNLPKIEERIGKPLSPYAVSKLVNELYAQNYVTTFGFKPVGLRYFNVFGPRQDPNGAYAAVIPRWIMAMMSDAEITINGDGETSRDFCFVGNAVQANIRAALADDQAKGQVYNVAVGGRTTLNNLFEMLREGLTELQIHYRRAPIHGNYREGDVRHSQADISKARRLLHYEPSHSVVAGLREALPWYVTNLSHFKQSKNG